MKIVYFGRQGRLCPGILTDRGVVDVEASLISHGQEPIRRNLTNDDIPFLQEMEEEGAFLLKEEGLHIGPCVSAPSKIICIGLNYRRHALESGMTIPALPVVFTKYNNTLVDYGGDVSLGKVGYQFDYEVELGVVMGRRCKGASAATALDHVMGYCVANDLSCRDLQFRTSQWLMGKSLDHFLPLGKYMVTKDEVGDPQRLRLTCSLNEKVRQDSNTSDMIFSVAEIISDLSAHMTLEPGDLILTGTPEGVIMGMQEKNWLRPGDVVSVEIERLGSSRNKMI
ncbi:MAG: fumarylacetoacetate hydrolase family protein [Chitinophagaceae bacterium]|nr:fumarylacetoacetate hydrolase family protein [Chitinophagaceae bacterium]